MPQSPSCVKLRMIQIQIRSCRSRVELIHARGCTRVLSLSLPVIRSSSKCMHYRADASGVCAPAFRACTARTTMPMSMHMSMPWLRGCGRAPRWDGSPAAAPNAPAMCPYSKAGGALACKVNVMFPQSSNPVLPVSAESRASAAMTTALRGS